MICNDTSFIFPYGVILVEEVTPLVLDIEEESEHDHDVDEGYEGHDY